VAFNETTKQAALRRAGGQCECRRLSCSEHPATYRCQTRLAAGRFHFHHKTAVASGGDDSLSNCEVLCIPCHERTQTYGAH
jgi:5-methylcytosine-specific restriction protein A